MLIELGYITKPQGIKGEFRLRPNTTDGKFLKGLTSVVINGNEHAVKNVTLREGFVIFGVEGITDRNQVELLRNVKVYYEGEEETLEEGEYFIADLIGITVISKNRNMPLGKLTAIDKYGAADVYTVKSENSEFMFPFARDVITKIDLENKVIYVDEIILNEIKSEVLWKLTF